MSDEHPRPLTLFHVGRYVRNLQASLARLFENTLDWEHLPHLHSSSFTSVRLLQKDAAGWRAEATLPNVKHPLVLQVHLNAAAGTWVARTTREHELLSEVATRAEATGERSCRVTVNFYARSGSHNDRRAVGDYYQRLYTQLYDEDEAMMIARQHALDSHAVIRGGWRNVRLTDGEYSVPRACPHLGLPLDAEPDADGVITCPWHGFRFDVRSGRCVQGRNRGWKPQQPST